MCVLGLPLFSFEVVTTILAHIEAILIHDHSVQCQSDVLCLTPANSLIGVLIFL